MITVTIDGVQWTMAREAVTLGDVVPLRNGRSEQGSIATTPGTGRRIAALPDRVTTAWQRTHAMNVSFYPESGLRAVGAANVWADTPHGWVRHYDPPGSYNFRRCGCWPATPAGGNAARSSPAKRGGDSGTSSPSYATATVTRSKQRGAMTCSTSTTPRGWVRTVCQV